MDNRIVREMVEAPAPTGPGQKGFKITFEIITPESAEQGDVEESGWIDEEGTSMDPDKWDLEDGKTAVDLAVKFLQDNTGGGGLEASTSGALSDHDWWTSYQWSNDYNTGEEENRSFHPYGFTEQELNEINRRLSGKHESLRETVRQVMPGDRVAGRPTRAWGKRSENAAMEQFLAQNGVKAKAHYIWDGSLRGTWRLSNLNERWTPEWADRLNALGFLDYSGKPLGPYSGNGGMFQVFVRGHQELLPGVTEQTTMGQQAVQTGQQAAAAAVVPTQAPGDRKSVV
jgi:hypothetical protein